VDRKISSRSNDLVCAAFRQGVGGVLCRGLTYPQIQVLSGTFPAATISTDMRRTVSKLLVKVLPEMKEMHVAAQQIRCAAPLRQVKFPRSHACHNKYPITGKVQIEKDRREHTRWSIA